MSQQKMNSFLVLWMPAGLGDNTVDKIVAIDAWAASYGLGQARKVAKANSDQYGKKMGHGRIQVVMTNHNTSFFID